LCYAVFFHEQKGGGVLTKKTIKLNAIDKALTMLVQFAPQNREIGTIEMSERLGLHKATVSRILLNLTRHGFLMQNPKTRKFRLGPTNLQLSGAIKNSIENNVTNIAIPLLDELRDLTKETVVLDVPSGETNIMVAYIAEGPRPVRIAGRVVGDLVPAHVMAGAKAILAFSSKDHIERILGKKLERYTANTITDPKVLRKQLEKVREQGFAFDLEEYDDGVNAIAAPIFDYDARPLAAVVIPGPSNRVKPKNGSPLVKLLKDTAAKISYQLYFEGPKGAN
jgi:DNA-binding IclR family transcriptional regulator